MFLKLSLVFQMLDILNKVSSFSSKFIVLKGTKER